MRAFLVALVAVLSQATAQAQDKDGAPPKSPACFYTLEGGQSIDVPVGASVCRRSPAPYADQYAVLRCGPPLVDIALVKRGDPRCDRYEDRQ
jgi:hypothetical protein